MIKDNECKLAEAFKELVGGRNFVQFREIESALGISTSTVLALKMQFEAALKRDDPSITIASRIDLEPPGFEIVE